VQGYATFKKKKKTKKKEKKKKKNTSRESEGLRAGERKSRLPVEIGSEGGAA